MSYEIYINIKPQGYKVGVLRCSSCKNLTPCIRLMFNTIKRPDVKINVRTSLCNQCLGLAKSRIDLWMTDNE